MALSAEKVGRGSSTGFVRYVPDFRSPDRILQSVRAKNLAELRDKLGDAANKWGTQQWKLNIKAHTVCPPKKKIEENTNVLSKYEDVLY